MERRFIQLLEKLERDMYLTEEEMKEIDVLMVYVRSTIILLKEGVQLV